MSQISEGNSIKSVLNLTFNVISKREREREDHTSPSEHEHHSDAELYSFIQTNTSSQTCVYVTHLSYMVYFSKIHISSKKEYLPKQEHSSVLKVQTLYIYIVN